MQPTIRLRPANSADAPLFYRVVAETMHDFVVRTWGKWDEARVLRESQEDCMSPCASVVLVDDEEAGVLNVDREPTQLRVQQIYLLSSFQRRGIGTRLMNEVLSAAKREGKSVCLRVLRVNSAKVFYEHLGFSVTCEEADFVYMQRAA